MSAAHISTTMDYLTDAAHVLRASAPETSAYIMRQRNDLLFEHSMSPTEIQRQHVCGACGNIMIPGDGTLLKLEARKSLARKRKPQLRKQNLALREAAGPIKTITCGRCSRTTKTSLPAPDPAVRRKTAKRSDVSKSQPPVVTKPPTANASSKKRAKNRKAGLQALLSGQQRQTASPLTLGDFMKK